ncbi:hypothetical protein ACQUW6_25210 [Bacillus thuringiensis]|uniref:hypothetical protein n=1 Tax=Bacillus thuringiensis TaxID=1428 RepID=UPI003D0D57C9
MGSYFYGDYEHGEKREYLYDYEHGDNSDYFFGYDYGERRKKEKNRIDDYGFSAPICNVFKILKSGDDVDTLIISGKSHSVDAFVSFDEQTGLITFVKDNGAVFIVGCNQIDAIIIDN